MKSIYSFLNTKMVLFVLFLFTFAFASAQCVPTGIWDSNTFNITNVQVTGDGASAINNFTGADNSTYSDFTANTPLEVTAGNTYNVTIDHAKETWGDLKVKMWIDYEGNGTYVEVYDSGAYVGANMGNTYTTNASFTVNNAALGNMVLRIAASYHSGDGGSITNACTFVNRAEIEDYTLNVTPGSATPVVQDDTLTVEENSTAGVNNQVDVGANDFVGTIGGDGDDFALVSGATSGTVTETGTDGVFQYVPNPGFFGTDSFTYELCNFSTIVTCETATVDVTVNEENPVVYCGPTSVGSYNTYYITNVDFAGINYSTTGTGGQLQNYTATPSAFVTSATTEVGNVTVRLNNYNTTAKVFVWIDFNNNGLFTEAGEEFEYNISGTNTVVTPISIIVPAAANFGNTRMRVAVASGAITSCNGNNQSAEYEDYTVNIAPASAPPVANCQDIDVTLDSAGNATIVADDIDNDTTPSSDDGGTPSLAIDIDTFDCSNLGDNTVTLTATDGEGQTHSCTATVTVIAYAGTLVAPTLSDITAACSYTVPTPADLSYSCIDVTPTTTDNTTFTSSGSITWLYDDGNGNTDTAVQNVTITSVAPTNIVVSAITQTGATVSWDDALGDETYSIRYREAGDSVWTTVAVTVNTYDITGLNDITDYEFEVATSCGLGLSAYSTTSTFTTLPINNACVPDTSGANGNYFISNVNLLGENAPGIDNPSAYDGGYADYTATQSADVIRGGTYPIEISVSNYMANENRSGWTVYLDLNGDGQILAGERVSTVVGEDNSLSNTDNVFNGNITIPATSTLGSVLMRVGVRRYYDSDNPCGNINGQPEEFEDYIVNIENDATAQEIDVSGNAINIVSGTTTTDTDNYTYFGIYDINSGITTRSYLIENTGIADLVLQAPYVNVTGSAAFTVSAQPTLTTLMPGESTTFTIGFDPDVIGSYSGLVSILSNDVDENPFTFTVEGEGAQTFPDTDGDGVPDNIDIDDDNDGLTDAYESNTCASLPNATTTDLVFLNENFGAGTNRIQINGNYAGVTTTYCYEDGTGSLCPAAFNSTSVNDGDYTVHHTITNNDGVIDDINTDISNWANDFWYAGLDHTPGDTNGRMAIFNAAEDPGVFYSQSINGLTPGVPIEFGFYAINIDRSDATDINTRLRPEVVITIYDNLGNVLATETSGEIEPTDAANLAGDWVEVSAIFTTTVSQIVVELTNAQTGGAGNDLAIDDIFVKQTLCDMDGDGVADIIDLDNDNDGIPNVVELGYIDDNYDATVFNDATNPWLDINQNGMHDAYEGLTALDSDGDGVPNHMDLDSDNDGIFDNVEYNGFGDIDVNGDGVGEGSDYQDTVINDTQDDQDGDGILPSVDDNDDDVDGTFDTDHGTFSYNDPIDSDGDTIPDYLDVDSNDALNNPSNGNDISATIYAGLDANGDGVIDGNIDADSDGLLDAFDTDDVSFGSPRDLDNSYSLFFDGRNDYVEDSNVLVNGNATITAWIKTEGNNTLNANQVVAGQDNFYLVVNSADNSVTVMLNGSAVLTSTDVVVDAIWTHVAATTTGATTVLYVNGEAQGSPLGSGGVNADVSNFTIGRLADTDSNYFHGEIDEVRVFDTALTEEEIQRTVYQELEENQSFNQGKIIPKDISTNAIGGNLLRYYKMDGYKGDITDNKVTPAIDQITGAKLYNIKDIYLQTAPLPYQTVIDGAWATTAVWLHGDVWDITDEVNNKAWSIVDINNNVDTDLNHTTLGLFVEAGKELEINTDAELKNTWYLELNGFIDLAGESQLVQTNESDLVVGANGKLERDQQGTENLYTYNYFTSPVHSSNPNSEIDGDETYTVGSVMLDGTDPSNPLAINFNIGYNGDNTTSPIKTSSFWLYKYSSQTADYYNWEQVLETGSIKIGEGYSMKGPGLGTVLNEQNYTFSGKPNNGTILLPIAANNSYLIGNPYASAIDADMFILDNTHLGGALYFWDHFGGGTHNTSGYQGGYGVYNLSGGTPAIQHDYATGGTTGGIVGIKRPRRYIPVGQGFFVDGLTSGDVKFENNQRIFVKETGNTSSWFFRSSNNTTNEDYAVEDLRPKFRFGFKSPETYQRQILLTVDENATGDYDWGYDAKMDENNVEDMYWEFANNKFLIQGTNETLPTTVLPIAVKTLNGGIVEISIDVLENVDSALDIYLKDNNIYHNLRDSAYITTVETGVITNRFEIVFTPDPALLSVEDFQENNNISMYANGGYLTINNPLSKEINNIQVINMLGQVVLESQVNTSDSKIKIPMRLQTGAYIFMLKSTNFVITKKVIINSK
ncbi:GEVED domain-containing protein [Lacinutrix mariniflava]|uniref:GEVED domain-containing protein n=1 Tax=Lacinutrix mariniflava TaxID=342955 RepID=UPI0006E1909F|nr:GEVED domain-containing protein [Lacinutrix mariniflava]